MRMLGAICCALLFSSASTAWAAGEMCEYDLQCSQGESCWEGTCTDDEDLPGYVGADDACGTNRRCRIDRLRRRGEASRRLRIIDEERAVEEEIERVKRMELDARPREKHPWNVGLRITRLSFLGATLGYTFAHPFRVEASWVNIDDSYYNFDNTTSQEFSGDISGNFFDVGLVYTVLTSTVSPYFKVGVMYGGGDLFQYSGGFFGGDSNSLDIVFHALNLEGGFDVAFDMSDSAGGLHIRAGAAIRPLIYHQARIEPGIYDESGRDGLNTWWNEQMFIDLNVILGWQWSF